MIDKITTAAIAAFKNNQIPWILSAVTDTSYEEGGAARFETNVGWYESSGLPSDISARMRKGINGFLEEELDRSGIIVEKRNRRETRSHKKPDFIVRCSASGKSANIESKLCYDCTASKYYPRIAEDCKRLLTYERDHAFQIVYMVSLPNYSYPSGHWDGEWWKSRQKWINRLGIEAQCSAIQAEFPIQTDWQGKEPCRIAFESAEIESAIPHLQEFFGRTFQPDDSWNFDPRRHLSDAGVAIAIWQWR